MHIPGIGSSLPGLKSLRLLDDNYHFGLSRILGAFVVAARRHTRVSAVRGSVTALSDSSRVIGSQISDLLGLPDLRTTRNHSGIAQI
jgi:hypothetical protein